MCVDVRRHESTFSFTARSVCPRLRLRRSTHERHLVLKHSSWHRTKMQSNSHALKRNAPCQPWQRHGSQPTGLSARRQDGGHAPTATNRVLASVMWPVNSVDPPGAATSSYSAFEVHIFRQVSHKNRSLASETQRFIVLPAP